MTLTESFDFSTNQLSGKIPQSMSSLSFLSHLNLSNNHLTGQIPSSIQLQSLDASCFAGNSLCGAPLLNCFEKNAFVPEDTSNGSGIEGEHEVDWLLYASMALGFVVGFGVSLALYLPTDDGDTTTIISWTFLLVDLAGL